MVEATSQRHDIESVKALGMADSIPVDSCWHAGSEGADQSHTDQNRG